MSTKKEIIIWKEEIPDGSAYSPSTQIRFQNGTARIVVSNTQSEIVTLSAQTPYGFEVRRGTIQFGKLSKKGIGTQLIREPKDI